MKKENVGKNRFEHLLAYDHSRVRLRERAEMGESDYINANFISGYMKQGAYIAAQSPFDDESIYDFWYMIYTEEITHFLFIANLTEGGVMKSVPYWPETGSMVNQNICVRSVDVTSYANFVIREFDVLLEGRDIRRCKQYHFTSWPEHGIPQDPIPFLDFRRKVNIDYLKDAASAPLLVHCGTGVSRTAVYIAVDSLMEQARLEHAVNVFKFCRTMRNERVNMVRTVKQYIFIYNALFEGLITTYNIIKQDLKITYRQLSNKNPINDKQYFREQFEILEDYLPDLDPEKYSVALKASNASKNRFISVVPPDEHRVILSSLGAVQRNDYINAVYIDSYMTPRAYILAQTPLNNTVADFWKMVYENKVNDVTSLIPTLFIFELSYTFYERI